MITFVRVKIKSSKIYVFLEESRDIYEAWQSVLSSLIVIGEKVNAITMMQDLIVL